MFGCCAISRRIGTVKEDIDVRSPELPRSSNHAEEPKITEDPIISERVLTLQRFINEAWVKPEPATPIEFSPGVFGTPIGSGGNGTVYKVTLPGLNTLVAVKTCARAESIDDCDHGQLQEEQDILTLFQHPHIIGYLGKVASDSQNPHFCLDFMLELGIGCLFDFIDRAKTICILDILRITRQISTGLAELNRLDIIHRDLKPENILFCVHNNELIVKICDFGFAIKNNVKSTSRIRGTADYMAPEIFSPGTLTTAVDVFSLGMILYEMMFYNNLYQEQIPLFMAKETPLEQCINIKSYYENPDNDFVFRRPSSSRFDACRQELFENLVYLIELTMQRDPADRPKAVEIVEMVEGLFQGLPSKKTPLIASSIFRSRELVAGPVSSSYSSCSYISA